MELGHAAMKEHVLYGMKNAPVGSGIRLSTRLLYCDKFGFQRQRPPGWCL